MTVHQSLFISPCSHVFHYKCIRPLLNMHHPGFSCPLCRTFANLEEDVEVEVDSSMRLDDEEDEDGEMDVDGAVAVAAVTNAKAILGPTDELAEVNAGAETESEREHPGYSPVRSRGSLARAGVLTHPIPSENPDEDENAVEEADWPPLAVPVPAATVVGGPGPYVGIARPMSAPVRNPMAPSLSAPLSGPAAPTENDSYSPRNRNMNYTSSNVNMHSNTSIVDDMYDDVDPSASGSGSGGEADADMHAEFSSGEGVSAEDRERTVGEKRKR